MERIAALADNNARSDDDYWQAFRTVHVEEQRLGRGLCPCIIVASPDVTVQRRLLSDDASTAARVIGIDGSRVDQSFDTPIKARLSELTGRLNFLLDIVVPSFAGRCGEVKDIFNAVE